MRRAPTSGAVLTASPDHLRQATYSPFEWRHSTADPLIVQSGDVKKLQCHALQMQLFIFLEPLYKNSNSQIIYFQKVPLLIDAFLNLKSWHELCRFSLTPKTHSPITNVG